MTGKIMPLRERDTSTIQAAADAFLSSPRYANPNTRRGYTGVLDRLLAALVQVHGRVPCGRAPHVPGIAEAARRVARARSSRTAAVAATRAAPTAMRAICQPGMPPAVTALAAGAWAGPQGGISFTAQAAGMTAADASRVQVTAARAAASRRSRAAACHADVLRCVSRCGMRANMMASCLSGTGR